MTDVEVRDHDLACQLREGYCLGGVFYHNASLQDTIDALARIRTEAAERFCKHCQEMRPAPCSILMHNKTCTHKDFILDRRS